MSKMWMVLLAGLVTGSVAAQAQETKPPAAWAEKVSLKGDLRYRYESIQEDGKEDRTRDRIRARVGVESKPSEDVTIGIRLSTAQDGDPVSSNQTLDESGSRKDVYLDLAFLDWHPASVKGLNVTGGKMEMPFAKVSDLVWDNDLNPEGLAVRYAFGDDGLKLLLSGGSFWMDERSSTSDDAMLYGGQVAAKFKSDVLHGIAGVGYYGYENVEGYATLVDPTDGFGNSVVETVDPVSGEVTETAYASGYEIVDAIAELGFDPGVPVAFYGNYAVNQDADDEDTAYLGGLRIGKTKEPGSVEFDYNYREVEADAVLGALTDSDFIGGGTDGKGHKVSVGVQLTKVLKGQVTYFMNEIGLEGDGKDYDRLQVDVSGKF